MKKGLKLVLDSILNPTVKPTFDWHAVRRMSTLRPGALDAEEIKEDM
jgi:hypothetical protein